MKVFVTLLLFAAITMTIVNAQARGQPHTNFGSSQTHGSSAKIGSSNPARNVNIKAHTQNSKTRAKPAVGMKPAMKPVASRPAAKPAVGMKPAMKPVASKPAAKPAVGIKPAIKSVAPKPAMKPVAEKPVMKPVADKKPVATSSVNHGKPASIRDDPQKNTKPENVKTAVKPLAGKPAMKPVAEKKTVVNPSVNHGKPASIRDNPQKNTKPENLKPVVKPLAEKPAMKPVAGKKPIVNVDPIAKPVVKTPVNAQNNQEIGSKPVSIQGTKDNSYFNTEVKIIDGKPVLDLQGNKKIYENKDTRVDLNGAATVRDGKKPEGSLDISGTKNGDSANAQVKFDDKKPLLDLGITKQIYDSKNANVHLNGAASLRDGDKKTGSIGIVGTNNDGSASAQVNFGDGKPALNLKGEKDIFSSGDARISLTGETTLQKDKKSELSFGIEGTKNSDSVNAGVKIVDGKPTYDAGLMHKISKDISLKTGVQHQVGGETQGILEIKGEFK